MGGGGGRGGGRPSRGRGSRPTSSARRGPTTRNGVPVSQEKENQLPESSTESSDTTVQPVSANNTQLGAGPRRSTRQIHATSNADPALLERMRPGRVVPASNPSEPAVEDGLHDPTAAEVRQESGLGSDDDEYEAPLSSLLQRQPRPQARAEAASPSITPQPTRSTDGPANRGHSHPLPAPMTASVHELASVAPSRLDRLLGPHSHSIPTIPSDMAIRNMVNPPIVPTPIICGSVSTPSSHAFASTSVASHSSSPFGTQSSPLGSPQPVSPASKRRADQALTDDEDPAARRARKREAANAARLRYKGYKYNATLYRVVRKAGDLLQVRFATGMPFPAPDEREDAVREAFEQACQIYGQDKSFYTLTDDDVKLLRVEDTNIRSRIKKAAIATVPKAYGLHLTPNTTQLRQNKDRVQQLLNQSTFQFEDPEQRTGRFQHPVISEIIWDAFFSHANALGCLYQEEFGCIPHELIALTLTCIRHVLKLWETGRKVSKHFAASQYEIYDQYLTAIDEYDVGVMQRFWQLHCRDIFKKGLEISGCSVQDDATELVIDHAAEDELNRELARMQERFGSVPVEIATVSPSRAMDPPRLRLSDDHLDRVPCDGDGDIFNGSHGSFDVFGTAPAGDVASRLHDPGPIEAGDDDDDDDAEDIEGAQGARPSRHSAQHMDSNELGNVHSPLPSSTILGAIGGTPEPSPAIA